MDNKWTDSKLATATILYDVLCTRYYANYNTVMMNKAARNIGNTIFDMGTFRSGYISHKAAIRKSQLGAQFSPCKEHFYPRQLSGRKLINGFLKNNYDPTFEEFLIMLEPMCTVHLVTKEENNKLRQYQSEETNWEDDYKNAGIFLVFMGHGRVTEKKLTQLTESINRISS